MKYPVLLFSLFMGLLGTLLCLGADTQPATTPATAPSTQNSPLVLHPPTIEALGQVTLTWDFDPNLESQITGFYIERNLPRKDFEYYRGQILLNPNLRQHVDNLPFNNELANYRIVAMKKDVPFLQSAPQPIILDYVPKPPLPLNFQADFMIRNHKRFVHLSWSPKAKTDKFTTYYQLYSTRPSGKLTLIPGIKPLTNNSYDLQVDLPHDEEATYGVAGVTTKSVVGPIASAKVVIYSSNFPPPGHLTARSNDAPSSYTLTWEYPRLIATSGFHLYLNKKLIADENSLTGNTHTYKQNKIPGTERYLFELAALNSEGKESDKTSLIVNDLRAQDPNHMGVTELHAVWQPLGNKYQLHCTWIPPVHKELIKDYQISLDVQKFGQQEKFTNIDARHEDYDYQPTDPHRSYTISIKPILLSGQEGQSESVEILGQGRNLRPVYISKAKLADPAKKTLELGWFVFNRNLTKGFRLYANDTLLADETTLPTNTTSWTTPPLTPGKTYNFELEAVGYNGEISERHHPKITTIPPPPR